MRPEPPLFRDTVGGIVTGLAAGQTLVLQNQGTDDFMVGANGSFVMAANWPAGSRYDVAVKTQPTGQLCTVAQGSGTLSAAVTDVGVACVALKCAERAALRLAQWGRHHAAHGGGLAQRALHGAWRAARRSVDAGDLAAPGELGPSSRQAFQFGAATADL